MPGAQARHLPHGGLLWAAWSPTLITRNYPEGPKFFADTPTVPPATTLEPSRLRVSKATAAPNGLGFPKPAEKQGAFCLVSLVLCLLVCATFSQKSTENE